MFNKLPLSDIPKLTPLNSWEIALEGNIQHVAPHRGTVCDKKILKLDVTIAAIEACRLLSFASATERRAAIEACCTEMVKTEFNSLEIMFLDIFFYNGLLDNIL